MALGANPGGGTLSGTATVSAVGGLATFADLRIDPPDAHATEVTGDVIVELGEDSALADLLRALHEISPQVFISRVPAPEPAVAAAAAQSIRVRKLAPGTVRG